MAAITRGADSLIPFVVILSIILRSTHVSFSKHGITGIGGRVLLLKHIARP
jgi:hypothetical protein